MSVITLPSEFEILITKKTTPFLGEEIHLFLKDHAEKNERKIPEDYTLIGSVQISRIVGKHFITTEKFFGIFGTFLPAKPSGVLIIDKFLTFVLRHRELEAHLNKSMDAAMKEFDIGAAMIPTFFEEFTKYLGLATLKDALFGDGMIMSFFNDIDHIIDEHKAARHISQ